MRIIITLALLFPILLSAQDRLKFTSKGLFKIVQFTDIHYVIGSEETKTVQKNITQVLKEEKPQLVVFTGDIITSAPQATGWDEVLEPVIKRGIPWVAVFGNHDDEYDWTRKQIMDYLKTKELNLIKEDPADVSGVGNYILEIQSSKSDDTGALIYCMDSHAYTQKKDVGYYAWFESDQVHWYRKESARLTQQNNNIPYPALAFFHIPLIEYGLMAGDSIKFKLVGSKTEPECPGIINTGMYAAFMDAGDVMGTFVGHDHNNNYIGSYYGIALSYGQFSGGNTVYNDLGTGARVIEMIEDKHEFKTWIRLLDNSVIHEFEYPIILCDTIK